MDPLAPENLFSFLPRGCFVSEMSSRGLYQKKFSEILDALLTSSDLWPFFRKKQAPLIECRSILGTRHFAFFYENCL